MFKRFGKVHTDVMANTAGNSVHKCSPSVSVSACVSYANIMHITTGEKAETSVAFLPYTCKPYSF